MAAPETFGEYFKQKRIENNITLREFCRVNGFDPGNISKIERGLFPPPQLKETLEKYARALNIQEGTDDWYEFCDLAATSAGKIPPDMVSNEELMKALPVLFRKVRDKDFDNEDLDKLIGAIKKELR
ncbi:MAG: helix-turn-helix domain-containing protein [Syntrophales bacterium]|nr:helix-turn-helix domain-containing protein [Syntrophales bacterium]